MLFARIGRTFSPISGQEVKKHSVSEVVDFVTAFPEETRLLLLANIIISKDRKRAEILRLLQEQGYVRIKYKGEIHRLDELNFSDIKSDFQLVIERIVVKKGEDFTHRLADSVATAFFEGIGGKLKCTNNI